MSLRQNVREGLPCDLNDGLHPCADAMPHVVWTADASGRIDYVNTFWRELTGVTKDFPHEGWWGALHPDDHAKFAEASDRALRIGEGFELEFRLRHVVRSGYRWQLGRVRPLRNQEGAISAWIGTCHDIHDQKTAEALLRTSEARLKTLIEESPVGVVILNPEGEPIYYNRKCAELRGHEGEVSKWNQALHAEDRERITESWDQCVKSGANWNEVYRFVHPDGETVWVSGRAIPIRSDGN